MKTATNVFTGTAMNLESCRKPRSKNNATNLQPISKTMLTFKVHFFNCRNINSKKSVTDKGSMKKICIFLIYMPYQKNSWYLSYCVVGNRGYDC